MGLRKREFGLQLVGLWADEDAKKVTGDCYIETGKRMYESRRKAGCR